MTEILLNTCVISTKILYNMKHSNSKLTVKQFRESLIDKILNLRPTSRKLVQSTNLNISTPSTSGNQRRSAPKHKLEVTEEKYPRNRKIRRRCTECYKKIAKENGFREALNKAKKVTTFCIICPSQPFICLSCFPDHMNN
ncbi:uncharacterized protein LOC112690873 [Sipha flava]|uniref:Uncharacterized protein LOC112690873 n=1 Tax=Sipha flava TaxID=143950 RepID=A0A8B8GDL0_9HEMI|nr:uncharacterized protein LOC112690873 [Sipha flava]